MLLATLVAATLPVATPSGAATRKTSKPKTTVVKSAKKGIWGPFERDGKSLLPEYKRLGVGFIMQQVQFNQVAPTRPADPTNPNDPAYRWPAALDAGIAAAAKQKIKVVIRLTGAPKWANGSNNPARVPTDPGDFAAFAVAAARHWPGVKKWVIWEETTRPGSFQPLVPETRGQPLDEQQSAGVKLYASLLDLTYEKLKENDPSDIVVGGNTFVSGEISPKNFIAALRLPDGTPPRMDEFAHNAFSGRRPDLKKPPLPYGFADFSDLDTLGSWVDQNLQRGTKKIPLFVTEFTLPTDKPNNLFNFYVSRKTQADWLGAALKIVRTTPRISAMAWYQYADFAPNQQDNEPRMGLVTFDGTRKPAFSVFARG